MKYTVSLKRSLTAVVKTTAGSPAEAASLALDVYPDFEGEMVSAEPEGQEPEVFTPVSSCEECGKALFDGDIFQEAADGSHAICNDCQTA